MKRGIVSLTVLSMLLLSTIFIHEAIIQVSSFATTTIFVDPSSNRVSHGQNFTININISNVFDLYGWEFRLNWIATILEAKNVSEGPFLKLGGSTFFTFEINNTEGYMLVDCTRLGAVPGVSGNGVLATVEFYVKVDGGSPLDFNNTILISSLEQFILHTSIGGYCYTSENVVGDLGGGLPPQFFNFDGFVDSRDLALFIKCYKETAPPEAMYLGDLGGGPPPTFFKYDGEVDSNDLALFIRCYKGLGP